LFVVPGLSWCGSDITKCILYLKYNRLVLKKLKNKRKSPTSRTQTVVWVCVTASVLEEGGRRRGVGVGVGAGAVDSEA
jgi:hypothetical protein